MMALMTIAFGALAFSLEASQPAWWTSRGAVNTNTKNDNLAINESQLKQFTQKAVLELNADLPASRFAASARSTQARTTHQLNCNFTGQWRYGPYLDTQHRCYELRH